MLGKRWQAYGFIGFGRLGATQIEVVFSFVFKTLVKALFVPPRWAF